MTRKEFEKIDQMITSNDSESMELGKALLLSDERFCIINNIYDLYIQHAYFPHYENGKWVTKDYSNRLTLIVDKDGSCSDLYSLAKTHFIYD